MKALTVALVVLTLAGCAAGAPPEHPAEAPSEPGTASEHGTASEEAVAYPVGFPTDRVPLLEGTLQHVAHPGNLWAAWIASDDLVADLATASQLLLDAGFTQTAVADGYAEFSDAERSLRIIASDDGTYGPCLAYTITDGTPEPDGASEQDDAGEQDAEPAEH